MADTSRILQSDDRTLAVTILRWPVLERVNRVLRRTLTPLEKRAVAVVGYEFVFEGKHLKGDEHVPADSSPRRLVVAFAPANNAAFSLATGRCVATSDWVLDDASLAAVRAERKRRWRRKRAPKVVQPIDPTGELVAFLENPDAAPANEEANA